jgi:hypothetical protein
MLDRFVQASRENAVAIMQQIAMGLLETERFS